MKGFSDEAVTLIARRFRALGEPTRIHIVEVLARGEQPVSHVVKILRADQSNISKHLQILFHAGLVNRHRSASTVIYSLSDPALFDLCRALAGRLERSVRVATLRTKRLPRSHAADRSRARARTRRSPRNR
jgi:DNA-binding transcriptional ArsR family regulator